MTSRQTISMPHSAADHSSPGTCLGIMSTSETPFRAPPMEQNPYQSPRDSFNPSPTSSSLWSRWARTICLLNTLASLSCFLSLALIPSKSPGVVGTVVLHLTFYWHLFGLPVTTSLVAWTLISNRRYAAWFTCCLTWCVFLLILWVALVSTVVFVGLSEG